MGFNSGLKGLKKLYVLCNFHTRTVHLDIIKVSLPTDAEENCFNRSTKIYIKNNCNMFRCNCGSYVVLSYVIIDTHYARTSNTTTACVYAA
jgi:hypothetical protein